MKELSPAAMDALFPRPEGPRVSTGVTNETGVRINGENVAAPPRIANGGASNGAPVITMTVGRIPVVIGYGGFHSP